MGWSRGGSVSLGKGTAVKPAGKGFGTSETNTDPDISAESGAAAGLPVICLGAAGLRAAQAVVAISLNRETKSTAFAATLGFDPDSAALLFDNPVYPRQPDSAAFDVLLDKLVGIMPIASSNAG